MAKLNNYNGSVELMAGITQKGGGNFALIDANAVQTREDGTRLDTELQAIQALIAEDTSLLGEMIKSYIQSLLVTGSTISYTKGDGTTESFNTTFVGTRAEYNAAYEAKKIPVGTIVVITDEEDDEAAEDGGTAGGNITSSILGVGVLGHLILG